MEHKDLNFMQAVALAKQGHPVKREAWSFNDGYRIVLLGTKHFYSVHNADVAPNVTFALLPLSDMEATDWRLATEADLIRPADPISDGADESLKQTA